MDIKIKKFYQENKDTNSLDFEYDKESIKPSWIHIKDESFNARFLVVQTQDTSEILYKRFTGNFYYPVNLTLQPEDEKKFYKEYSKFYDQFTSKNNIPMAQFLLEKINSLGISKEAKILDLGAGTGIFSNLAAEDGFTNLTLVDINEPMLDIARQKPALKDAKFINGDAEAIKLPDNYDALVSIMMFDALDDNKLENSLNNIVPHLLQDAYIFLIEDKKREIYLKYFEEIESGLFDISKERDLQKYYFIGKVRQG